MVQPALRGPFTVDQYQRLGDLEILRPDQRTELIAGQVLEMSPIGVRHAACVRRLIRVFTRRLGDAAILDVQNPVVLDEYNEPQPDVSVLRPRPDGYRDHPRPADIFLLIEVADTTLELDREVKLPRYAAAGVAEVWIANLPDGAIEVYRNPGPDGYASRRVVRRGETVAPLAFPESSVAAAEMMD